MNTLENNTQDISQIDYGKSSFEKDGNKMEASNVLSQK